MNENNQYGNPYPAYPYYYPHMSPAHYPNYDERQMPQQQQTASDTLPMEQSYIENILRLNRGKEVTVHMTFSDNLKTFSGVVEEAGRDHIIIKDANSEERYLLLMVYLDYITFNDEINYKSTFGSPGMLSNYPSR